jgi:large repetitive protein
VFMVDDGEFSFYHNDHLGTPQKMTDMDGDVVWSATYGTFGDATVDPDSTVTSNSRFPGQYFDEETGLHYNWLRYYDPEVGRYANKDVIDSVSNVKNLYKYSKNNTLRYADPKGDNPLLVAAAIGAVVGMGTNAVMQIIQNGGFVRGVRGRW